MATRKVLMIGGRNKRSPRRKTEEIMAVLIAAKSFLRMKRSGLLEITKPDTTKNMTTVGPEYNTLTIGSLNKLVLPF